MSPMKYTFSCSDEDLLLSLNFNAESWPEVLEHFWQFLVGCGFYITDEDRNPCETCERGKTCEECGKSLVSEQLE